MSHTPNLYGTHCSSHSTIDKAHKTLCLVYQNKSLYMTDMYTCSKFKLENKRKNYRKTAITKGNFKKYYKNTKELWKYKTITRKQKIIEGIYKNDKRKNSRKYKMDKEASRIKIKILENMA